MAKRYSKRTTYKKRSLRKSRSNRRRTQKTGGMFDLLTRVNQIKNAASKSNISQKIPINMGTAGKVGLGLLGTAAVGYGAKKFYNHYNNLTGNLPKPGGFDQ